MKKEVYDPAKNEYVKVESDPGALVASRSDETTEEPDEDDRNLLYGGKVLNITIGKSIVYVGKLAADGPILGGCWIRIHEACKVLPDASGRMMMSAIQGTGDFFEKWVDIYVPDTVLIEINQLREDGELYGIWAKESAKVKSSIIESAGMMPKMDPSMMN